MDSKDSNKNAAGSPSSEQGPQKRLFVVPKAAPRAKEKFKTFTSGGMVVIQSEFTDQLEALTNEYMAQYRPANVTEKMLVKDLATTQCRCEYVIRLQTQPGIAGNPKLVDTLVRYHATNQRQHKRSLKMLQTVQKERQREAARKPHLVKKKKAVEC